MSKRYALRSTGTVAEIAVDCQQTRKKARTSPNGMADQNNNKPNFRFVKSNDSSALPQRNNKIEVFQLPSSESDSSVEVLQEFSKPTKPTLQLAPPFVPPLKFMVKPATQPPPIAPTVTSPPLVINSNGYNYCGQLPSPRMLAWIAAQAMPKPLMTKEEEEYRRGYHVAFDYLDKWKFKKTYAKWIHSTSSSSSAPMTTTQLNQNGIREYPAAAITQQCQSINWPTIDTTHLRGPCPVMLGIYPLQTTASFAETRRLP